MVRTIAITVSLLMAHAIGARGDEINVQAMTTRQRRIVFSPVEGATLRLGTLADLSGEKFFSNSTRRLKCMPGERIECTQSTAFVVTQQSSVAAYQETAASVEASLSFLGSGNFRLTNQEAILNRENTLYARLAIIDGVQDVSDAEWPADWKLSSAGLPATSRTIDFVRKYGTHFVSKLYFGRMISIKATLLEKEKSRKDELEAKLRAEFMAFSLTGSFAKTAIEETKGYHFDLFIAINGGQSDRPEETLIRSFEELDVFVRKLQDGRFKLASTTVAADFDSLAGKTGDQGLDQILYGDVKLSIAPKYEWKYAVHEEVFNVGQLPVAHKAPPANFRRGGWGTKVIGAWWEPIDGIPGLGGINLITITPIDDKIDIAMVRTEGGGAFIRLRFHVIYSDEP